MGPSHSGYYVRLTYGNTRANTRGYHKLLGSNSNQPMRFFSYNFCQNMDVKNKNAFIFILLMAFGNFPTFRQFDDIFRDSLLYFPLAIVGVPIVKFF